MTEIPTELSRKLKEAVERARKLQEARIKIKKEIEELRKQTGE